jgi:hypothetical protein
MGKSHSKQSRYEKMGKDREMEPMGGIAPPAYEDANPSKETMQVKLLMHLAIQAAEPKVCATSYDGQLIIGMLKQLLKADCQICKDNFSNEGWKHLGNLIIFLMKRPISSHLVAEVRDWLAIQNDEMVFMMFQSQVPQTKVSKPKTTPHFSTTEFWLGKHKA